MTTQLNSSFRGTQDLPKWLSPTLLVSFFLASFGLQVLLASDSDSVEINFIPVAIFGLLGFTVALYVISRGIEGVRKATDRLVTIMVSTAFSLALIPLLSLAYTVVTKGVARFDAEFFTFSMRNVVGEGGGALHAIIGTIEITGIATLISVPIGIMAAIYLVEYGRGTVARLVTFFVDVMTGVPSIVAGLFAYALFVIFFGPGVRMGLGGAIALSLLMIPVVIRATEEMLKIVPNELREAAYALGVPKWLTVLKVVLPTSLAGIATGIMIAIARVIGETAPLLLIAGFTASTNYNLFDERMMTLPVFVYTSYANQGVDMQAYLDRAWAGALTLMLIVMVLNLVARLISKYFSPKG
jgi:phosphate transport system permease protein